MSGRVQWSGLAELRAALRQLPAALAGEATRDVQASANAATYAVRRVYAEHVVTGNLLGATDTVATAVGPYGIRARVVAAAPHSWWFDNGTRVRQWRRNGKNTGAMWKGNPPHIFVRTMEAHRAELERRLIAIVARAGFVVSERP